MAGRESMGAIEYETVGGSESFVDPFASDDADDSLDLPMTREDYGLSSPSPVEASRPVAASSGLGTSGAASGRGGGLGRGSAGPTSFDLAAALSAGNLALPAFDNAMAAAAQGKRYLSVERRGLWGQASYNVGYSYFGGLLVGGAFGFMQGLRSSPNGRPRVLLNSVLNGCGRVGSKTGNAVGMLALVYTCTERALEDVEVDRLPQAINNALGRDVLPSVRPAALIPALTALATGVLFTLPKAITMRGVDRHYVTLPKRLAVCATGGVATLLGVTALSVVGPLVFGDRSPFRFA